MSIKSNVLKSFRRDDKGHVAVMFGMTILPAAMLIGSAIDFGGAYKTKQRIQVAADAAVLAAVGMPYGTSDAAREAMAVKIFNANTSALGITPTAAASGGTVTVSATGSVETSFLKLAQIDTISVVGNATGSVTYTTASTDVTTSTTSGKVCLLALDPSAVNGFKSQGTPNVDYTGCWAHTNSTSATSVSGGGNAVVVGAGTSGVGGIDPAANGVYTPAPIGNQMVTPDPFATVSAYQIPYTSYQPTFTPPAVSGACKASNINLKKGTFTLEPGRYCGGINIQAGAKVTFQPGVYIIDNGIFNVQSGSTITGTNVMFYFHGAAARMTIIGGGSVNLKGRQTGSSYEGFLMIQHPDAWRGLTSNIQGGGNFTMEGMVYMPTQNLLITGNGDSNGSSNMFAIVAKSFEFRGNGVFRYKPHNAASNMPDLLPGRVTTTTTTASSQVVQRVKLD